MKRVCCLVLSLLICFASLSAFAQEAPSVADLLDDILHLEPQDRAQLMDLASAYMSAMGESMPVQTAPSEPETGRLEGDGFATPEEAALQYLSGLKERNVEKMLRAFAIETYVENYDLELALEQMGVWMINMNAGLPGEIEMYNQLNAYLYYGTQVQSIRNGLLAFQWEGSRDPFGVISVNKDFESVAAAYDFLCSDRSERLETISDIEFVDPLTVVDNTTPLTSERALAKQDQIRQRMGADELAYPCAMLKMDGSDYCFTCSAARYGDRWYLYDVPGYVGAIMGINAVDFPLLPAE